ncbi:MAG: DUF1810 domain-containing protein [Hyphomicrobiales bacterium]|nr:DUF1810 domain-containing protein [Hyphomicrobiales bacterium]
MNERPDNPYDLQRFVDAQERVYERVCAELEAGRKQTHWMWFIFPQLAGLGRSAMAIKYAISGTVEARAHLAHPVLGKRLRHCTQLVNNLEGRTAEQIFGPVDTMKFRSSMSLFAKAGEENREFEAALQKYFDGVYDESTLERI